MYDQNPLLWNARIHNTDGRLTLEKTSNGGMLANMKPQVVISVLATAIVAGLVASGIAA